MTVILGLSGCVTIPEQHEGAATGSGIGAVAGAVGGALIAGEGSRTKGAIIGGLAGALIGGVIGNYTVDQKKSAAETTNKYNYQSSAGTVVRIEGASARPSAVKPGEKVDLEATYAVMTPSPNTPVSITEAREVRLNNELVGNPEVNVSHAAGTYTSSVPLFLPADARKGTYKVIMTIRTDAGRDSRETSFIVR
jgi:surface antigen